MSAVRAFLVGGPADGKVLEFEGPPPLDFRVPVPGGPAALVDRYADLGPLKVEEYRSAHKTQALDGKAVVTYVHNGGEARRRTLVIVAESRYRARLVFEARLHRGDVEPEEWHQAIVVRPHSHASTLRGLRGENVRVIRESGTYLGPDIEQDLAVLFATGASSL